ncbi:MAG TPA: FKBP-type peptidyl-prolyl cis-trans isomerase [Chitinophagaceae bacterium]|nr:MAG: FKBP-type peptidylprolyl isomerase [Bacteroidetes bacterium OLB11]HMN33565.1 FKBP-type peptidyl-prolyl cis-trans isomerase [Chitinophagaceae bacterium]
MKIKNRVLATFAIILAFSACKNNSSFTKLKSGLEYQIVKDNKGPKAALGDMILMNIKTVVNDSVLFDSHNMNNNEPIPAKISAPQNNGDLMEGLVLMGAGDSAVFRIPVDSLFKNGQQMPPFMKSKDIAYFYVNMVSIKSEEEFNKEEEEKMKELIGKEDEVIQKFIQDNKWQANKTPSGLYYVISKRGAGENASKGKEITMKYTGKLLDGTTFDSNVDPKFNHTTPFTFILGQGMVIRGWDEGIALFNKGTVAKLIIPSTLAYGKNGMPGNPNNAKGIPANSPLVFDVEVMDIANPATK